MGLGSGLESGFGVGIQGLKRVGVRLFETNQGNY